MYQTPDPKEEIPQIEMSQCAKHQQKVNMLICIDSKCGNLGVPHCLNCSKENHKACDRDYQFQTDEFMRLANINDEGVLEDLSRIKALLQQRDLDVAGWDQLVQLIQVWVDDLNGVHTRFTAGQVEQFQFAVDVANQRIDITHKLISKVKAKAQVLLSSANRPLAQLNAILKELQLERYGIDGLIATKQQITHCVSKDQVKCCLCQSGHKRVIQQLSDIMEELVEGHSEDQRFLLQITGDGSVRLSQYVDLSGEVECLRRSMIEKDKEIQSLREENGMFQRRLSLQVSACDFILPPFSMLGFNHGMSTHILQTEDKNVICRYNRPFQKAIFEIEIITGNRDKFIGIHIIPSDFQMTEPTQLDNLRTSQSICCDTFHDSPIMKGSPRTTGVVQKGARFTVEVDAIQQYAKFYVQDKQIDMVTNQINPGQHYVLALYLYYSGSEVKVTRLA